MVDVHDSLPRDGFAVPMRLHNVLLALAGRLDDSALSEARELVARSHLDDAAELATGALIAGRIMVTPTEQRELALVLELSRSDAALADQLTVGDSVPGSTHRFTHENQPERGIAEALDRTLQVLPDLRSVHAVWRNTPAGSVPGPLPQRVVLIEIGPEAHPPAVAFRVDDALRKAGIRAVVEVTGPGAERTEYHEAALAAATPVWLASSGPTATPPQGRRSSRQRASADARVEVPRSGMHAVAEPGGPVEAEPVPAREATVSVAAVPTEPTDQVMPAAPAPRGRHESVVPEPVVPEVVVHEAVAEPEPAPEPEPEPVPAPQPTVVEREPVRESEPTAEERENRAAQTTELTPEEFAQLRAAIAEDPERGRAIANGESHTDGVLGLPELELDDPQLSDRDRQLLRELHAELAERERVEAAKVRTNGVEQRWGDGFPGN